MILFQLSSNKNIFDRTLNQWPSEPCAPFLPSCFLVFLVSCVQDSPFLHLFYHLVLSLPCVVCWCARAWRCGPSNPSPSPDECARSESRALCLHEDTPQDRILVKTRHCFTIEEILMERKYWWRGNNDGEEIMMERKRGRKSKRGMGKAQWRGGER